MQKHARLPYFALVWRLRAIVWKRDGSAKPFGVNTGIPTCSWDTMPADGAAVKLRPLGHPRLPVILSPSRFPGIATSLPSNGGKAEKPPYEMHKRSQNLTAAPSAGILSQLQVTRPVFTQKGLAEVRDRCHIAVSLPARPGAKPPKGAKAPSG